MSFTKFSEKLIWKIFYLDLLVIAIHLFNTDGVSKIDFDNTSLIQSLVLLLPIIAVFLHSTLTLGIARGLAFIGLAALVGFWAEFYGLQNGTFFGGAYIYKSNSLTLFTVPVSVIFFWAVFIYMGYSISNSFLYWLNKSKPTFKSQNILNLIPLVLLDGCLVTAIDLFMDPIQVKAGNWSWIEGGVYFGVPIGNFIGWFTVTIIVTTLFRLFEYFKPEDKLKDKKIFLVPVLSYAVVCISFAISAFNASLFLL